MKQFTVYVDFRITKGIIIDADNKEQAEQKVKERLNANPYPDAMNPDSVADFHVVEVMQCECEHDEDPTLKSALDYVSGQLDADDLIIIKATVSKNLNHRLPVNTGIDDGKVIDLLEEYGADNNMPEGWWQEYGDIEDILIKL